MIGRLIRYIPALIIVLVIGLLSRALTRNVRTGVSALDSDPLDHSVDLALRDIRFSDSQNGVRKYRLKATSAAYSAASEATRIEGIDMVFLAKDGQDLFTLTAPAGDVATGSGEVSLQGGVTVTSRQGYTLQTDHLKYRKRDDLISTDAEVKVMSRQMSLTGQGMLLNMHDQKLILQDRVRARFTPDTREVSR